MRTPLLFPLLAFSVYACGGSSFSAITPNGDGGPLDGSIAVLDAGNDDAAAQEACATSAQVRCQRFDACSSNTYNAIHYGGEAACEAAVTYTCLANLTAPGTGATPATVTACAQAIPSESCADYLGENPPAACATAAGSLANGAACAASAQCQSTYCAVAQYATCGVCAEVPKAGDSCVLTADCGSRGGLTCLSGACAVLEAAGGACAKDAACAIGLVCVGVTKTATGTCQAAAAAAGAACDPKGATNPRCDATLDLVCIGTACAAETIAASGATCGDIAGGITRCGAGGTCDLGAGDAGALDGGGSADAGAPTSGVCLAAANVGGACDVVSGPACALPSKCVVATDGGTAGTCTAVNASDCH